MAFPNTNISDILATTLFHYNKTLVDNASAHTAVLFKLNEKGNKQFVDGGHEIRENFMYGTNANGAWYDGADELTMGISDNFSGAQFSPKQLAVPIIITGRDEAMNQGEAGLHNLVKSKVKHAETTMLDLLSVGLYSDGTGSAGKTIAGFDAMLPADPTTGTYGGINRATAGNEFWRSQLVDVTITAANVQAKMNDLWNKCVLNRKHPDLIGAGATFYGLYEAALQPLQRFTDPKMAETGFESLKYKAAAVVMDGGVGGDADTEDAYFINTDHVFLKVYKGRDMVPLKRRESFNQDLSGIILAWMGALTSDAPRLSGRLKGD